MGRPGHEARHASSQQLPMEKIILQIRNIQSLHTGFEGTFLCCVISGWGSGCGARSQGELGAARGRPCTDFWRWQHPARCEHHSAIAGGVQRIKCGVCVTGRGSESLLNSFFLTCTFWGELKSLLGKWSPVQGGFGFLSGWHTSALPTKPIVKQSRHLLASPTTKSSRR